MAKVTVQHEFDMYEEQSDINILMNASKAHLILWDVDQEIRNVLKHGEDDWLESEGVQNFLEKLREMIWESGVLNEM